MSPTLRSLLFWIVIFGVVVLLWQTITNGSNPRDPRELTFNEFLAAVEAGQVKELTLRDGEVTGRTKSDNSPPGDNQQFKSRINPEWDYVIVTKLVEAGAVVTYEKQHDSPWLAMFLTWGPVLLIVGLWVYFMRQFQAGGNKALSFGKSKAKLLKTDSTRVTFSDVGGLEEVKAELTTVVEFLKDSQRFQRLGGRVPNLLLTGSPGTGKTLLARAIAGEASVPFYSNSGSGFVELFVGLGASRVRDLFAQGKKNAPCIVFIDEIDALGRHRHASMGPFNEEREQTLNQLLTEMDGFEPNEGVIVVAATNRPDVLDSALLRPGRFDRQVVVDRPDVSGRIDILRVHTETMPLARDVDLQMVARRTPGFSGADLANLVNEAALSAALCDKRTVQPEDFETSLDRIVMGLERKSLILTDEDTMVTAYHEAGHSVVAAFLPGTDPLHKVTILPRGRALGLTMQLPLEDRYNYKKRYVEAQIAVLMAGRVAEELTQDDITTGAGNDFVRANEMARQMIYDWGMSELGPIALSSSDDMQFLARGPAQRTEYGEELANKMDREVSRIVNQGYEKAKQILSEHRTVLERLAQVLLERESIEGREVYQLIEEFTGQDLVPESIKKLAKPEQEETRVELVEEKEPVVKRIAARVGLYSHLSIQALKLIQTVKYLLARTFREIFRFLGKKGS